MNQATPKLYKIRSDKLDVWQSWCAQLQTSLHTEATAAITQEGLISEFFIGFALNGEHYTIGAMIVRQNTPIKVSNSALTINKKHRAIMLECLEPAESADFSYILIAKE